MFEPQFLAIYNTPSKLKGLSYTYADGYNVVAL